MRRWLAFALVLWLGNASEVLAGETLLASATRLAREAALAQLPSQTSSVAAPRRPLALLQQEQLGLASSGMSKRKKVLIWLAAGVGFTITAYTIDHKVRDDTPSSLGTRKD
jgi:hypothetical protein